MIRRENLSLSSTIFALASGKLPSAVAILRLSGPKTFSIINQMFSNPISERGLYYGSLLDSKRHKLDEVVLLAFKGPHSFTGEDVVEIQCHGSLPIVEKIQDSLVSLGCRPAERGEFTYRAMLNEKMSPEAVAELGDVFSASSFRQIEKIYQRRKEKTFETEIQQLKESVIKIQAILDTAVDFSEEYSNVAIQSLRIVSAAIQGVERILMRSKAGSSKGFIPRLVLAGLPNAGKSSLFNLLLSRYRAVVHEEAGTTRDVIEEDIRISEREWKLVDTAGIREATGFVEQEGISLGRDYLSESQVWVWVADGTCDLEIPMEFESYKHIPHLVAWNKNDRPDWKYRSGTIGISCKTGDGLSDLWNALNEICEKADVAEIGFVSQSQIQALSKVQENLKKLEVGINAGLTVESLAEDNRLVLQVLESVIGEVTIDDVLDRIFTQFCIGK